MTNEEIQAVLDALTARKSDARKALMGKAIHYVATHAVAMAVGGACVFVLTKLL